VIMKPPNSSLDLNEIQFQPGNFQKNFIGIRDHHLIGSVDSNAVDGECRANPQQNQCERKHDQQPPLSGAESRNRRAVSIDCELFFHYGPNRDSDTDWEDVFV
jgi:hypothetical protein